MKKSKRVSYISMYHKEQTSLYDFGRVKYKVKQMTKRLVKMFSGLV